MIKAEPVLSGKTISFGQFQLLPAERLLRKGGKAVNIGGRAFDILMTLLDRPQEVVTNRELSERTWPGLRVDESCLRFHITAVRKLLGDGREGLRYIVNVPRRGYCFVAPVSIAEVNPEPRVGQTPPVSVTLPASIGKIVGRDDSIRDVSALLQERRLVSIVGPGGVGKTTVALAVGHSLAAEFERKVFFVDFTAITDAGLVPSTVSAALGLRVTTDDPFSSILAFVRDKRLVLILDGCEHVVAAAAALAEAVIKRAPNAYMLATSRESLRAEGELVFRLQPLAYPPKGFTLSATQALSFPAVQLFMERLNAPDLWSKLQECDIAAVGEICRRLDGIALAIELAASRVDTYGIQGIVELLDTQLALHLRGRRSASPRQQTLSATLDWSYNLLSETERAVSRRLSVFLGCFSWEAAQCVASGGGIDNREALEALSNLVAKSLAVPVTGGVGLRYRLLDTTRTYLLRILRESHEANEIARRHAGYELDQLKQLRSVPAAVSRGMCATIYSEHLSDIRAALEWSFSGEGEPRLGVSLAVEAAPIFLELSLLKECRVWMDRAAASLDSETLSTRCEMELQASLALSLMLTDGNTVEAHAAFDRSLQIAEALDDLPYQFRLLGGLQLLLAKAGRFREALVHAKRGADIAEALADPGSLAISAWMLGTAYHLVGDQADAQMSCEIASDLAPVPADVFVLRIGYDNGTRNLGALARVLWLRGFPDRALGAARDAVEQAKQLGHPASYCIALTFSAPVFLWVGDWQAADNTVQTLLEFSEEHSLRPYLAIGVGMRGRLLSKRGDHAAGTELLQDGLQLLRAGRHEDLGITLTSDLAEGLTAMGDHEAALSVIDAAIDLAGCGNSPC